MNGATPTGEDFTFKHLGVYYAIGHSATDEAYALSKNTAGTWSWELVESGIDSTELTRLGGYDVFLSAFIDKVNKKVFGGDEPNPPTNELEKLLDATKNGLTYTSSGIVINK